VDSFPPTAMNDEASREFCPAFGLEIDKGLCWECCMADHGGPTDTAERLRAWVTLSSQFTSVADFQRVCAECQHCAWRPARWSTRAEPQSKDSTRPDGA
jgi:hypothetical protein